MIDQVKIERGKTKKAAITILKVCSSDWGMRSTPFVPNEWCLIRSRTFLEVYRTATILRSELRRLFPWLKEKGGTAIITGERGEGQLTRHGLEKYVSDRKPFTQAELAVALARVASVTETGRVSAVERNTTGDVFRSCGICLLAGEFR